MAIQVRRGANADFDASKMLPGELAVTTDGTRKVYAAFQAGDVKELAFKEDVRNIVDDTLTVSGKAADAAVVGKEVSKLSGDIADLKNEIQYKNLCGTFVNGSLNTDGKYNVDYSASKQYRVCMSDRVYYTNNTKLKIADGFRIYVHYYEELSGTNVSIIKSGWVTDEYIINSGYYVALTIARITEDTTEIANIDTFTSAVQIYQDVPIFKHIRDNENRILALENNISYSLVDYWKTYLDEKLPSIEESVSAVGNHGDYFGFFTDYHTVQNARNTSNILRYIKDNTAIQNFVCGGDILTDHTKEEAVVILKEFVRDFSEVNPKLLLGNHELNRYTSTTDNNLDFDTLYPILFKQYENDTSVIMENGMYYYSDNHTQKIRYIYLNTNYGVSAFLRDTIQVNWLIDTLNSVKEDWCVVVFTHIYFDDVNNDFTLIESVVGERIKTICEAYNNKIKGSHSCSTSGAENTITFDFTNAKGFMSCIICGHSHNDYTLNADGFPIICTTCDAYQGSSQNPIISRTRGTYTEQAIDLFFIDTTEKTINTIRLGVGSNRNWSYGN